MKRLILKWPALLLSALLITITACDDRDNDNEGLPFVGAVYAMTNSLNGNSVVAYGRNVDGRLTHIGNFDTNGLGGDFDGPEGLDPLISAYALTITDDHQYVLAANAGSNTITLFEVNEDFTLTWLFEAETGGIGPNSIAYDPDIRAVYVTNIDEDGVFTGEADQEGSFVGFWLTPSGRLVEIQNSRRSLGNRPSAVQFSPDGEFLVVTSINAGSAALASGSQDEVVVFAMDDGIPSDSPLGTATSTLRNNEEGRNLPSAIGFQVVGNNYVVVTEAREFLPDGTPPVFSALQTGSVSTWQIEANGSLTPINLDVLSGDDTNLGRTACWLDFNRDESVFFVSNAIEASLAAYSFDNGQIELINPAVAQGQGTLGAKEPGAAFANTEGWIDLWVSPEGLYLYQLYGLEGTIGVYRIEGEELRLLEEVSGNLPTQNTQGIVAF